VSKKTEKPKKITEKIEPWKKLIKPRKFLEKPFGLVWFGFYKNETEKSESNQTQIEKNQAKSKNRGKPEKTQSNRFEPVFVLKNRTEPKPIGLNLFQFVFFKYSIWLLFFDKNRTEPKIITHSKFYYFSLKPFAKKTNTQTKFTCHYIASHVPLLAITRFHVEVADCNIKNSWPLGPIMLIT
jgi:hypothetical protein